MIGAAVPTLILVAFCGYLYQEHAARAFLSGVYRLKMEADALEKSGKTRLAFEKYEQILAMVRDRRSTDAEVQKHAAATKEARDRLYQAVREELRREEMERRAQAEAQQAAAEARAEAQKLAAEGRAEADRLSTFSASVIGGAWLVNKLGHSDVLRGLHVHLIPAHVQKKEMAYVLKQAKDRATLERAAYERILVAARGGQTVVEGIDEAEATRRINFKRAAENAVERVNSLADDHPIDTNEIYSSCRLTAFGMAGMVRIVEDRLWPDAVSRCQVRETTTNIDGKYKFENVTGGKYYLYALHATEYFVVEWLVPIVIDRSGELSFDLFNERAALIINKSD